MQKIHIVICSILCRIHSEVPSAGHVKRKTHYHHHRHIHSILFVIACVFVSYEPQATSMLVLLPLVLSFPRCRSCIFELLHEAAIFVVSAGMCVGFFGASGVRNVCFVVAGGDGVRRDVLYYFMGNLLTEVFSYACETRNLCKRSSDQVI